MPVENILVLCAILSVALYPGVHCNSVMETVNELICQDSECTQADNLYALQLNAYYTCILIYNSWIPHRQCNLTRPLFTISYPFCALKDDNTFCATKIFNRDLEIPSTCESNTTCSYDCRTALHAKFGCCLHLNIDEIIASLEKYHLPIINSKLVTLIKLCEFSAAESCQLAMPKPPDYVPMTQCPDNDVALKGICEVYVGYTQDLVNKAVDSTCLDSRVRYAILPYLLCEHNDDGYCDLMTYGTLFYDIGQYCSMSSNCTSLCRRRLIEVKEMFGCCVHTQMHIYIQRNFPSYSEYFLAQCEGKDIWSHCKVTSPGFCNNRLVLNGYNSLVNAKLFVIVTAFLFAIYCTSISTNM